MPNGEDPGSIAKRWAVLVLRGCASREDFKTLKAWAKLATVSYTSLREACYLLDIKPRSARDFCRLLRALLMSPSTTFVPALFLDIRDRRTMARLFSNAGVTIRDLEGRSRVERFLKCQRLIPRDNPGVLALERALRGR